MIVPRPLSRSSSSYSYTGTPVRGVLQIDQRATGTAQNAAGTQFVTLLSFDASAVNEDVIFSTVKFHAEQGNLTSANEYTLFAVAKTGQLTKVATAAASSNALVFTNLKFTIHNGQTQRFVLQGKVLANGSSLALAFQTSDPLFVQAQGLTYGRDLAPGIQVDGIPCTGRYVCRIIVHTKASRSVTVNSVGNLYVTTDSVPSTSHQLLLGTTSDAIFRLKFHATEEDVAVTYVAINGMDDSISGLELFTEGSSAPFSTATELQCDTVVSGQVCARLSSGLFTVTQSGEVRILARALLKAKNEGGVSGETVTPSLSSAVTAAVAVKAEGRSSGKLLSQNNGDSTADGEIFIGRQSPGANTMITGVTHDTVAAKFAAIENANPDPDLTLVPLGLSSFGIFRFRTMPSGSNNSVVLTKLVFTVNATNVIIESSSVTLVNTANTSIAASCTTSGTTGVVTVTCDQLETTAISTTIDPGGSITLALRGTISRGTESGTSYLQATLGQLGNRASPGTVEWTDGFTSFDWVDLPVTQVKSTQYRL